MRVSNMMTGVNLSRRRLAIMLAVVVVAGVAVFGAGRMLVPHAERIETSSQARARLPRDVPSPNGCRGAI